MNHLIIGNRKIPYEERRSTRLQRITLSILEDRVRISAPKNVTGKQLKELLNIKQDWILKHWLAKQDAKERRLRHYIDGEQFLYRGHTLELKVSRHARQTMRVFLKGQALEVYLPQGLQDNDCALNVREALLSWYKVQARKVLKDKLDGHAKLMKVTYQGFRLKEQKTRWGSCSNKGNINLNWRIIMAPDAAIDYIIIHELAHLTHLNHSEQFWQRVMVFMPEYAHWKKWFRDYGQELVL